MITWLLTSPVSLNINMSAHLVSNNKQLLFMLETIWASMFFALGSFSPSFCSFPSWWEGGAHPSSSSETCRRFMSALWCCRTCSSWRTAHELWHDTWILRLARAHHVILLWFLLTGGWLSFKGMQSVNLKQTSPHHHLLHHHHQANDSLRERKPWKFNFLAIRTAPS